MTAPKPICVIYFPELFTLNGLNNPLELATVLNGWDSKRESRPEFLDYLWFCFTKEDITAPEFQVFHPKDFTDIQLEELKSLVLNSITNLKKEE